jgi:hypothetical protein
LVRYTGAIYSVLLERDDNIDAHAIALGGGLTDIVPVWGVTLGHGMVEAKGSHDVRAHRFFGSYEKVLSSFEALQKRRNGVIIGGGVKRSKSTGLVIGFKAYQPQRRAAVTLLFPARAAVVKRRRAGFPGQKGCKAAVRGCLSSNLYSR